MSLIEGEEELIRTSVAGVLHDHEAARENLIPILLQVQEELGYLPALAMEQIATALQVPAVDIYGLATFYNQFRLHPPGKHQVKVAWGPPVTWSAAGLPWSVLRDASKSAKERLHLIVNLALSGSPVSAAYHGPGSGR